MLAGESCQTVADAIGVHPSTVYGWIRKQRYAKLRRQRHRRTEASWVWFRFFYGPVLMGSVR
ncbi:helix-turn-helix domain-containing protein [Corynebacterium evansiae]|uniref:helix-turn-helix domain-containing protein n=1 Tax=Corynebacterium evansiae TaxID=2913499 RepID=UPI003EBA5002